MPISRAPLGQSFEPELLDDIRQRFHHIDYCPISGNSRAFFANASGSLKLKAAIESGAKIAALPDQIGHDYDASRYLSTVIDQGRKDLELFLGADDGVIISGETGTELLFRCIRAVALGTPAGPVISSNLEHSASHDAAHQWAERTQRRWVEIPLDCHNSSLTGADYAEQITADTRIATIIHSSPITGFQVDLLSIARAIRAIAVDCYIIVDGIQHAAHSPISVRGYGVDAYVFSPYKVYSQRSGAFAWLSPRLLEIPHDGLLGMHPEQWELGARDPGLYAAHSAIVEYLCWLGSHFSEHNEREQQFVSALSAMAAHERYLLYLLLFGDDDHPGLSAIEGVSIIGSPALSTRAGIVSFNLRGSGATKLVKYLGEHGIRLQACGRDAYYTQTLSALGLTDCVCLSLCHYNSPQEIRSFLQTIANLAG